MSLSSVRLVASCGLEWTRLYRWEASLPGHAGGVLGVLLGPLFEQYLLRSLRIDGDRLWRSLMDLAQIGAPPADTSVPPYGPGERSDITPNSRWISSLTIE